ncbi:hypothetical protein DPMN_127018 [Dreissena polymorpha]|uniref:HECT-type E3 ubiquitin transferase n=1 Tax=Dreissena polymorpha TaxID=45954 RepID=A0A9D4GY60_DREPO|nr:hypothetical protein DPMN_127018 [Dreissena polymorpha]
MVMIGAARNRLLPLAQLTTRHIKDARPSRLACLWVLPSEEVTAAAETVTVTPSEVMATEADEPTIQAAAETVTDTRSEVMVTEADEEEEPTIQNGFYEAGTPTILFRTLPMSMLDATRSLLLASNEETDAEVPEEIPEVNLSNNIDPTSGVPSLGETIREHASLFISQDMEDPFHIEVRRSHVFRDALQSIRFAQGDLHSPLRLTLTGEEGVDLGGLRREFWSLFLNQATMSSLFTGKAGRLTLAKNYIELKRGTFRHLGQLVALSILQDGPGLPIFADVVVNHLLDRRVGLDIEDLPDSLVNSLKEMDDSPDRELAGLYSNLFDEACAAGFSLPTNRFSRAHIPLLKGAFVENLLGGCLAEMEQFKEGLQTHQILDVLQGNKDGVFLFLSGRKKEVTAAAVRDLLQFNYREGKHRQLDEETAQGFRTFL